MLPSICLPPNFFFPYFIRSNFVLCLQDFVALAKWEDRGYYALRSSTEKTQRQLHRLTRKAVEVLREPASAQLTAAARSMGFNDLSTPTLDQPGATPKFAAGAPQAHQPDGALLLADSTTAAATFRQDSGAALTWLKSILAKAVVGDQGLPQHTAQLPHLTTRFLDIVHSALAAPSLNAGHMDSLASEVAGRALALRMDNSKGAKARKKKALVDLFKSLADAGVSKRRTTVPISYRGAVAWLQQVLFRAILQCMWATEVHGNNCNESKCHMISHTIFEPGRAQKEPAVQSLFGPVAADERSASASLTWCKADAYYFRAMARMRRLLQVGCQWLHPCTCLGPSTGVLLSLFDILLCMHHHWLLLTCRLMISHTPT
jgi:hypothetical protein